MTEMCGEVADGLLAHAFTTKRYADEVTMPALLRGLRRASRDRNGFQVSCPVFVVTVIMSLLGVPESDFPRMLQYTQELFGNDDAEFGGGGSKEDQLAVLLDMFGYFTALTASRRERPTEDLASAIANARVDGEPLSDVDTVSYYVVVATAGHDTTSATISGGLQALIENPDQLQRLGMIRTCWGWPPRR
jgi:cytochrome P450